MGAGKRAYGLYSKLPDAVRCHTDGAIRLGAKATRRLRSQKERQMRGEELVRGIKRRLGR